MDYSIIKDMLHKDAITAGYGVLTGNLKKGVAKVLGSKNIGSMGVNAVSIVAGIGLSQVNNPHLKIIGSALRISGIATMANELVQKVLDRNKTEEK